MRIPWLSLGPSCAFLLLAGCAGAPRQQTRWNPLAAIVPGKTAVFCLKGDVETKHRLEGETTKKLRSAGLDTIEGRPAIPPSDSYSAEGLAIFLRAAGFLNIGEITYGGKVTSAAPDVQFYWLPTSGEKHFSTTRMELDAALRTLIDSLGSSQK